MDNRYNVKCEYFRETLTATITRHYYYMIFTWRVSVTSVTPPAPPSCTERTTVVRLGVGRIAA